MNDILNIAIGSITIGGVVIFLGKKLIDKGFDAALKTFENRLDMLKYEHQIRFSKLHEERASFLKNYYVELYDLEKALAYMTTSFQDENWTKDDERKDIALEKLNKCKELLEKNRFFFMTDFCDNIEKSLYDCQDVILNMEKAKRLRKSQIQDLQFGTPVQFIDEDTPLTIWRKQENRVNTDIKNRRIELANEFRIIIGVNKE